MTNRQSDTEPQHILLYQNTTLGKEYYIEYNLNYCTTTCKWRDTLQLGRQSWLMKAAGPSHSCAQFLRHEYITLKSFTPGRRNRISSSWVSSARQPTRPRIFSPFNLHHPSPPSATFIHSHTHTSSALFLHLRWKKTYVNQWHMTFMDLRSALQNILG